MKYIRLLMVLFVIGIIHSETIVKTLPCPGAQDGYYAWGMTFVNGYLYVGDDFNGTVYVVDTSDGSVVNSFSGPNDSNHGLAFDGTYLWYASYRWTSPYIYKLTLDGVKVDSISALEFAAGDYIGGITWDGNYLWVSIYYPNIPLNLYRVDVNTHTAIDTIPAQGTQPYGLAWDGQYLWNAMDDNDGDPEYVWKLNPNSGDTMLSFPVPTTRPRDLTWDGEALWLIAQSENGSGMTIYKIDPYGGGNPEIFIPTTYHNFGNVNVGDTATWDLQVFNTGDADLILDSVLMTSPNFFVDIDFPVAIQPSSSFNIPVLFTPTVPTYYQSTMTVFSNDLLHPTIDLNLEGTGVLEGPEIFLPDTAHNYGSVRSGAQTRWWLQVINLGNQTLVIDSIKFEYTRKQNQGEFFIFPYEFPINVYPADTSLIPVWYWAPQSGDLTGTMLIFNNDATNPIAQVHLFGGSNDSPVPEGQPFWTVTVHGDVWRHIRSIKPLQDLTGDSIPEIVAVSENDTLYCINGNGYINGDVIWKFPTSPPYLERGMITIPDVDGDGVRDIAIGTVWGGRQVRVISGRTGSLIWQYDTHEYGDGGWVYEVSEFVDLTGDSIPEILACAGDDSYGTGPKRGYCFNSVTGEKVWEAPAGYAVLGIRPIGDINNDGIPEVAMATADGVTQAFNVILVDGSNGGQVWLSNLPSSSGLWTVVPVGDVNSDGIPDIAAGTMAGVLVLSGINGQIIYSIGAGSIVSELNIMDDINSDGFPELLPAGTVPNLYNINPYTGGYNWIANTVDMVFSAVPMPDITGDGIQEIIVGTGYTNNEVAVYEGSEGNLLWSTNTNDPVESVYWIPSLDNNETPDIVIGTRYGKIAAYSNGSGWQVNENHNSNIPLITSITPTVTSGPIKLSFSGIIHGSLRMNVYDISGRRVKRWVFPSINKRGVMVDLSSLAQGVYILQTELNLRAVKPIQVVLIK